VTIRNNHIWNCGNSGGMIFSSDSGDPASGYATIGTRNVVEGNFIGSKEAPAPFIPASNQPGSVTTIRNNTFWACCRTRSDVNDTVGATYYAEGQGRGKLNWYGNVFMNANAVTCADDNGGAFEYNILGNTADGCHAGKGNVVSPTRLTGGYPDWHLARGQTAAKHVPIALCAPGRDMDGDRRSGRSCDAGADER
jgi:hypothetical protein